MTNREKTTFIVALGIASLLFTAPARAAGDTHAAWEGFLTFTGAPPAACNSIGGMGNGDTHVSVYRPKLGSSDTSPSFLSILFTRAGLALQNTSEAAAPQFDGTGNYTGYGVNGRGKAFTYTTGSFTNVNVTPSPVTSATNAVTLTGTLNNLFNTAGCNRTFKATYVKRID